MKLLINGQLVDGNSEMMVINPATEQVVSACPRASIDQIHDAIAAAKAAFPRWSATDVADRRALLVKIAAVIDANARELAELLTKEQGKPLSQSSVEVAGTAAFFRHVATLDHEPEVLEDSDVRKVLLYRRPLGVVAAIIPWNFPLILLAFKVPAALLTGNTVVVKPAATTPLSTLRLGELIANIVPPGVINIVTDANDLGDVITGHPDVRKVSFTGSTATGLRVMQNAAKSLKRVSLELGGNDPGIVLEDADVTEIAQGIFDGAFLNSGQVCLALKRLYVHEKIYDALCTELARIANEAVLGDGLDPNVDIGPVQNKIQFEKLKSYLKDAASNGVILSGGLVEERPGYFIRPTIVRDIPDDARLVQEEQFGPILPILRYTDIEDAIARANQSEYGLGASVWSSDATRAQEVALRLDAGTVWINKHIDIAPHIPQAGAKQSGIGVEIGQEGLNEFTQVSVLNAAPCLRTPRTQEQTERRTR